jgi:hypothetical protein
MAGRFFSRARGAVGRSGLIWLESGISLRRIPLEIRRRESPGAAVIRARLVDDY